MRSILRRLNSRYLIHVALLACASWLFWEGRNQAPFEWWNIDGYPTLVASKLWLAGHSEAIYNLDLWVYDGGNPLWKKQIIGLGILNAGTAFVYHPLYLYVCAPLVSHLSADQFAYALVLLNAVSLGVVGAESLRLSDVRERSDESLALFCIGICFPALYAAYLGQNILPALALLMLGFRCSERGRPVIAAILLTLSSAMKIWMLPIVILIFLIHGRRACWTGFLIMVTGLVAVPMLVEPTLFKVYLDVAARLSDITVFPFNNFALRAMLERAGDSAWADDAFHWVPHSISGATRVAEKLIQGAVGALAIFYWYRNRPSARLTFVVALSILLLVPGVCWSHYMVMCIPLACFLWMRGRHIIKWIGAFSLIFLALPWHALPTHKPLWPINGMIEDHPDVMIVLLFVPLFWFVAVGFVALANARELDAKA